MIYEFFLITKRRGQTNLAAQYGAFNTENAGCRCDEFQRIRTSYDYTLVHGNTTPFKLLLVYNLLQ